MLFQEAAFDRLLLEYDDERSGGFEALRSVRPETTAVLGLVTSKSPELESEDDLLRRLDAASQHIPLDRLALSTQCGFASVDEGNALTPDDQFRKLELVVRVANKVWSPNNTSGSGERCAPSVLKLTMTSRWKSGRRRYQGTFVVARRRRGDLGVEARGRAFRQGRCKPAVRSMKRSLPRRDLPSVRRPTGSRVSGAQTKAREGVKSLEQQPRRTQRRRGRGTLAQPSWEQERAVSAPAVRPMGCHLVGGLGASSPISRVTVKWARAERQSERRIVPLKRGNARGGKAPHLVCASGGGKRW